MRRDGTGSGSCEIKGQVLKRWDVLIGELEALLEDLKQSGELMQVDEGAIDPAKGARKFAQTILAEVAQDPSLLNEDYLSRWLSDAILYGYNCPRSEVSSCSEGGDQ